MAVRVDLSRTRPFIADDARHDAETAALQALGDLLEGRGPGAEFTGWIRLPDNAATEAPDIAATAAEFAARHPVLVVVGIGGSYLGTRAALNFLGHPTDEVYRGAGRVVFAGHHLSGEALGDLLHSLRDVDYAVNVVSKSGTTTEPGIAFRVLVDDLRTRHGEAWPERVVATTDARRGALRALADELGFRTFAVPDDVGGRFSVLTPVGLFPLAFAGADIAGLAASARSCADALATPKPETNPALQLSAARHALYRSGLSVDVLTTTSPRCRTLAAWWQQLFGESEGKDGLGPFPAVLEIPADLHSLGQYLQDGKRQLYETVLHVDAADSNLTVPSGDGRDGLDYLEGRPIHDVLDAARRGTIDAHVEGGVPVIELSAPAYDEAALGELFYFFEMVVAISGRALGVNPFDQPGVEAYKRNMFQRLGRPGY